MNKIENIKTHCAKRHQIVAFYFTKTLKIVTKKQLRCPPTTRKSPENTIGENFVLISQEKLSKLIPIRRPQKIELLITKDSINK